VRQHARATRHVPERISQQLPDLAVSATGRREKQNKVKLQWGKKHNTKITQHVNYQPILN
jgi:hypothetical protein